MADDTPAQGDRPDRGFEFLDAPLHEGVRELYAYWDAKRAGRPMPDRADINLADLRRLAPNLVITEPADDAGDFRVRLYGSALPDLTGEERTGKLISQIGQESRFGAGRAQERWQTTLRRAFETASPVFIRARASVEKREHVVYHGAALPLTKGGASVAQLLCGLFVEYDIG